MPGYEMVGEKQVMCKKCLRLYVYIHRLVWLAERVPRAMQASAHIQPRNGSVWLGSSRKKFKFIKYCREICERQAAKFQQFAAVRQTAVSHLNSRQLGRQPAVVQTADSQADSHTSIAIRQTASSPYRQLKV